MHAQDDRYSTFFLFTEKEVALLCDAHKSHHVRTDSKYELILFHIDQWSYI
jgi:hypothetical protein